MIRLFLGYCKLTTWGFFWENWNIRPWDGSSICQENASPHMVVNIWGDHARTAEHLQSKCFLRL